MSSMNFVRGLHDHYGNKELAKFVTGRKGTYTCCENVGILSRSTRHGFKVDTSGPDTHLGPRRSLTTNFQQRKVASVSGRTLWVAQSVFISKIRVYEEVDHGIEKTDECTAVTIALTIAVASYKLIVERLTFNGSGPDRDLIDGPDSCQAIQGHDDLKTKIFERAGIPRVLFRDSAVKTCRLDYNRILVTVTERRLRVTGAQETPDTGFQGCLRARK
ncbi:uncharacterized protein BJ212DRAFT_1301555 [Suillus subaureus]|uniref:Uncharacterized protein n=1 Tax=Suillus subaureus TaxID=48587 RepID=A0A9P7E727_9AGAM|nr:uncharacterized protein BJ212DRAFT_1301555 [Suillus subaureus]KAG1812587.1 hypothetical protein BJ212DRAFT_1301555 [Suillus subaureus]